MATSQELYSDLPIPPGEYLEEVIEELGMSKEEPGRPPNSVPSSKATRLSPRIRRFS
jgi:hypothetical protein